MEYENRLPPEGINTSRVHPLKQFAQLIVSALVLVVILVFALQFFGSFLAKRIPFDYELKVMEQLDIPMGDAREYPDITTYLNDLAERLGAYMPIPEGMTIKVHYENEGVINAFATVGGNLLFYRGLLEHMPDENTLAMVMAHEISHVLHRDPIAALGGGVVSSIALLGLVGNAGTGMAGTVLNNAGLLTRVQFTRKMEVAADDEALAALNALYGHINGATALFDLFSATREGDSEKFQSVWLERFLSTHPRDEDRILRIREQAQIQQWQMHGDVTPLPAHFKRWLRESSE